MVLTIVRVKLSTSCWHYVYVCCGSGTVSLASHWLQFSLADDGNLARKFAVTKTFGDAGNCVRVTDEKPPTFFKQINIFRTIAFDSNVTCHVGRTFSARAPARAVGGDTIVIHCARARFLASRNISRARRQNGLERMIIVFEPHWRPNTGDRRDVYTTNIGSEIV